MDFERSLWSIFDKRYKSKKHWQPAYGEFLVFCLGLTLLERLRMFLHSELWLRLYFSKVSFLFIMMLSLSRCALSTIMTMISGFQCQTFFFFFAFFSAIMHLSFGVVKTTVLIKKKNRSSSLIINHNDELKSLLKWSHKKRSLHHLQIYIIWILYTYMLVVC